MSEFLSGALLLSTLLAVAVSIFAAEFARRQAVAAGEQVAAAKLQAEIAREQAEAARQQVAEAKRANDLAERHYAEQRAREAVIWDAELSADWDSIRVINQGFDVAHNVFVQAVGTMDDWDHIDYKHEEGHEVPPNEWVSFSTHGWPSPPDRVWVLWDGAERPLAVQVKNGPGPRL